MQHVCIAWDEASGTSNTESVLTNFTAASRNGVPITAATSYTVPSDKTLRIHTVTLYVKATSTVNNLAMFRIRRAASVANSSPIVFNLAASIEQASVASGMSRTEVIYMPEGIEVPGGQQITFTWKTSANTCTVGMTVLGFEF